MTGPTILPEGYPIDNFRIVRKLGRGGFGVTYLATELALRTPGQTREVPMREVALKEFFPQVIATRNDGMTVTAAPDVDGADHAFHNGITSFIRESLAIAGLDHPNVIPIFRAFEANGTAYYTMPYVRGESLRTVLRREKNLTEDRLRGLLLPILDGLAYAHARGVLHRDLKPDNIIIREGDNKPILIDFGTARLSAAHHAIEFTRITDLCAFTPGYAALEQYAKSSNDNLHGHFTDVYGLGAVLYEAVTGVTPNEATQRAAEVYGGRTDTLVPASILLKGAAEYSPDFLQVIDWATELASRDRPQTIDELREGLEGRMTAPVGTSMRISRYGSTTLATVAPATAHSALLPTVAAPTAAITVAAPSRQPTLKQYLAIAAIAAPLILAGAYWVYARQQQAAEPVASLMPDKLGISQACMAEAATTGCTGEQVGKGLLKCMHAYRQAHRDFRTSQACAAAIKKYNTDKSGMMEMGMDSPQK
jgi:serine/threonine protein kinase